MQTNRFNLSTMMKQGISPAISRMIAVVVIVLTLGLSGGYASLPSASADAAEPSVSLLEPEPGIIQQQRVDLIRGLRAENLVDFDVMERAPGLYTQPESSVWVNRDRVATIIELRSQNLVDFEAMERWPGLYT
jgi:hypothetical protein